MKLLSISVGMPREVPWKDSTVLTSIFKSPVQGPVRVSTLNVEGDQQSDLTVHGGIDKAVYAYPAEHYEYWKRELPGVDLPFGSFGENFTTEGLLETNTYIGDRLRIGSAEFIVTQPRMPCFKLGIRFGRTDIIKRFLQSRRSGFYLTVLKEGEVNAGDVIESLGKDDHQVSVTDIVDLYSASDTKPDLLRRASELSALPVSWREYFQKRMATIAG